MKYSSFRALCLFPASGWRARPSEAGARRISQTESRESPVGASPGGRESTERRQTPWLAREPHPARLLAEPPETGGRQAGARVGTEPPDEPALLVIRHRGAPEPEGSARSCGRGLIGRGLRSVLSRPLQGAARRSAEGHGCRGQPGNVLGAPRRRAKDRACGRGDERRGRAAAGRAAAAGGDPTDDAEARTPSGAVRGRRVLPSVRKDLPRPLDTQPRGHARAPCR